MRKREETGWMPPLTIIDTVKAHSPLFLADRLQYTTKGTKALRLLGDGGGKRNSETRKDQKFNPKESVLTKATIRANNQRRLLLKNGEVNISR